MTVERDLAGCLRVHYNVSITQEHKSNIVMPSETAESLARGVCRLLADVARIDKEGRFLIVEIKSSPADFHGDSKWPEYRPHCDFFYFAVGEDFPVDLLPDDCGLIVANAYHATIVREAETTHMNASRRRAQTRHFARAAVGRLRGLLDPR